VHLLAPTSGCSAIGVDETPEIEMYECIYVYVQQSIYHFGTKKNKRAIFTFNVATYRK